MQNTRLLCKQRGTSELFGITRIKRAHESSNPKLERDCAPESLLPLDEYEEGKKSFGRPTLGRKEG